jgi:choline dehydrogenase-like flavoprotein
MAGEIDKILWDVAIIGSGFAGALIAHELGKGRRRVIILEAGEGIPPNINKYMSRFYSASAKVPESPYTPEIFDPSDPKRGLSDPNKVNAGRPTVLSLGPKGEFGDWTDPKQAYLIQKGPRPFASTYDRVAGGTSHWLGTCLRFVPNDFKMKSQYGQLADWPIEYNDLNSWYGEAEKELGVSADVDEQKFGGIEFPPGHTYPMPKIPNSTTDQYVNDSLNKNPLTEGETGFLGMGKPVTKIPVRGVPAARNSEPYRNRRACAGNTNCIPICPIQAKYDPTITLNDARNTRFVTFRERTVAYEIVVGANDLVSEIKYKRYETETGKETDRGSIKARIFVIAANAIETPRLLLMSTNGGRTAKGAANKSDMVGRNLMDHPYYVVWGMSPKRIYPYRGPLITSGIGDLCDGPFRRERAAFRVDIGNEGWNFVVGGIGGDPNVTTLDFVNGLNKSRLNAPLERRTSALGDEALFGKQLVDRLHEKFARQFRCGFLIEQTPDRDNRVTLSSDHKDGLGLPRPQISYNLSDYTRRGFIAAYRMKNLLFEKMSLTEFTEIGPEDPTRFEEEVDGKPVTLNYTGAGHIMGTCRMGDDPKRSVVDKFQRSHDHKNLYLVGSSTFPTGATANPTLTIAALSLRTAKHILDTDFRR